MRSRAPRLLTTLLRGIVRLQPETHRERYGAEQILLFEDIWSHERPHAVSARVLFSVGLLMRAVWSLFGIRRDARRSAALPRSPRPRRGGSSLGTDVRFTLRALRHAPWYSATVVGVVAVTLALATTVFAVVDGVLFRPLPYSDAGRLVIIEPGFRTVPLPAPINGKVPGYSASAIDLASWRAAAPAVNITGVRVQPWSGVGAGINDDIAGVGTVQENFFDVLGVRPLIGGFTHEDFLENPRVRPVLLMFDTWQARFQGAPDILGRVVNFDPETGFGLRVRGVMPPGFSFPSARWDVDFLMPFFIEPKAAQDPRHRFVSEVIARLPERVTPAALAEQLARGLAATAAQYPLGPRPEGWSENSWRRQGPYESVDITPLGASLAREWRPMFVAVFAAVALLVLIAAANVSSLMTSRVLERRRELDMRLALGAGPGAIARLWTLEALLLIVAGGVLGAIAAAPALQLILALLPEDVVLLKPARLDWRVAAFVTMTMAILAVLVSAVPIYRSLRAPSSAAKAGASDRVRTRGRFVAICGQVAAAFVLTVVGACLVGSLLAVYGTDRPIRTNGVVVVEGTLRGPGDRMGLSKERVARGRRIVERLQQVSGVSDVALVAAQLLRGGGWQAPFRPPTGKPRLPDADWWAVTAGFYDTIELRPIEGRVHTDAELRSNAPLIVVSERIARAYWPDTSPIGQTLTADGPVTLGDGGGLVKTYTVIGVVPEVPWDAWDCESPLFYGPYEGLGTSPFLTFFIRTNGRTGPVIAESLRAVAEADPHVRLNKAATLSTLFRDSIALRRFQSWLFGGFAAAALVVGGVGILGLLAMSAARRTKEIGVRCALGATPHLVTRLLIREQLVPVLAGLAAGAALAAWAVKFIEGYVYRLSVADPRIWVAAITLIVTTAALGALLPARRASRIDPVKALREN